MESFGAMISLTVDIMKIPITIWGFTFSFWQVFLFSGFMTILAAFIGRMFFDD